MSAVIELLNVIKRHLMMNVITCHYTALLSRYKNEELIFNEFILRENVLIIQSANVVRL